jgi:hypothetical protein
MQLVFAPPDPPLTDLQGTRKCLVRQHDAPKGCLAHAKSLCGIIDVQNLKFIHFTIPIIYSDNQDAMSATIRMRLRGWILG